MSAGRKPDALAQRRKRDHVDMAAQIVERPGEALGVAKPAGVAAVPRMSELWDAMVGQGLAFKACDGPFLEQLVFDIYYAEACRQALINPDGSVNVLLPGEEGGSLMANPYRKELKEVTAEALKIAGELGLTVFARARLGLTQASANAVNISIADTVMKALAAKGGKG